MSISGLHYYSSSTNGLGYTHLNLVTKVGSSDSTFKKTIPPKLNNQPKNNNTNTATKEGRCDCTYPIFFFWSDAKKSTKTELNRHITHNLILQKQKQKTNKQKLQKKLKKKCSISQGKFLSAFYRTKQTNDRFCCWWWRKSPLFRIGIGVFRFPRTITGFNRADNILCLHWTTKKDDNALKSW